MQLVCICMAALRPVPLFPLVGEHAFTTERKVPTPTVDRRVSIVSQINDLVECLNVPYPIKYERPVIGETSMHQMSRTTRTSLECGFGAEI
ncbi:hypothetical protein EJ04DRAFT_7733 [Polyplosphaeria fusca]|uniref:Uncharacterized protein n=1 Tax=Polyplosphaeria fusca TaxID=682080 RepID=A0A9P4R554_9PLEO|nr:hypothetical protein EJ04DRAFT_7733 [Polyplosphaeria fusca]